MTDVCGRVNYAVWLTADLRCNANHTCATGVVFKFQVPANKSAKLLEM